MGVVAAAAPRRTAHTPTRTNNNQTAPAKNLLPRSHRTLSGSGSDIGEPYTEDSDVEAASADSASGSAADGPASAGGEGGEQEPWQIAVRAGALLAAGTALCAVFSGGRGAGPVAPFRRPCRPRPALKLPGPSPCLPLPTRPPLPAFPL